MNPDEYQSTAVFYDRILTVLLRPLRVDIRTFIHYRGHRSVIDICCGTGDQLQILEGDAMHLVGVDNSAAMLAKARNRCSDNVVLHLLDAEQMQPPEEPFDCCILVFSLHEKHPTKRQHIFNNARRMVKQGGSLILADHSGNIDGVKGSVIGGFLMPIVERCAGKTHYQNYLDWNRSGGLEGFLDRRNLPVDVISRPFGSAVLCCAVQINDAAQAYNEHIALLNRSLQSAAADTAQNHEKKN